MTDPVVTKYVKTFSQIVLMHIQDFDDEQWYCPCQMKAEETVIYACKCDMRVLSCFHVFHVDVNISAI